MLRQRGLPVKPLPLGMTGVRRDLPAIRRKARQLSPQSSEAEGQSTPTKAELRKRLRPIFDKFDADRSGAVSADELGRLLKQIKLERTPAQLKALMAEADPDRSGDVDFTEFVDALHKQMATGGGELTAVVTQTTSFFGFLNPLSWFAKPPPAAEVVAEHAPTPPAQHAMTAPKVYRNSSLDFPRALSPVRREECRTYAEQLHDRKCSIWTMDHELTDPFEC